MFATAFLVTGPVGTVCLHVKTRDIRQLFEVVFVPVSSIVGIALDREDWGRIGPVGFAYRYSVCRQIYRSTSVGPCVYRVVYHLFNRIWYPKDYVYFCVIELFTGPY